MMLSESSMPRSWPAAARRRVRALSAYHMLAAGADYRDLGETYLDAVHQRRTTKSPVRRRERLGYEVQLKPKAA
jgi:hypothetical protein